MTEAGVKFHRGELKLRTEEKKIWTEWQMNR